MREIKFRAWSALGRCMYDWEQMQASPAHKLSQYFRYHDLYEVMQYTGLLDKNGIEIYEGDIFKIIVPPCESNRVVFDDGEYKLLDHGLRLSDYTQHGEVVGNIYENPEIPNPAPGG